MNKDPRSELDTSDVLAPALVINRNLFLSILADNGAAVFREQEMVSPHCKPFLKITHGSLPHRKQQGPVVVR